MKHQPARAGEAPLLVQGSLFMMLERVGVLADFQLVYTELAASCSAMAAAVAAYTQTKQVTFTFAGLYLIVMPRLEG